MKKYLGSIIAVAALFVFFIVQSVMISSASNKYATAKRKADTLSTQIDMVKQQNEYKKTKVESEATGLDESRVNDDLEVVKTFFDKTLTWSTGAEYDAARESLIKDYKFSENDTFLTQFMPANQYTSDGKYNYVDLKKANSKFEDVTQYVYSIDGDLYSYFGFVTWSTTTSEGAEGKDTCVFIYSINGAGTITSMKAYVLSD